MKKYNRIMLGSNSSFADECHNGNFIGGDFDIPQDLSANLYDNMQDFKTHFIPVYLHYMPMKSKASASIACGFLWTICKGLEIGDVVLCPDGKGNYYVGNITSNYYYVPNTNLPHRRKVNWLNVKIKRSDMSQGLKNTTGSIGTCCNATKHSAEIDALIGGSTTPVAPVATPVPAKTTYMERDLHKLFCNYLRSINIIGKTIYHEQSSTKKDSNQKWVHPDIVGVEFNDFQESATTSLQKAMEPKKAVRIYSYELKRSINDDYQLKQYFFQALSNSNWANCGYLVAYEIDESLTEEIMRLNAAFGIGVILLQAKPADTKILCTAREKELDYVTIDKLCHVNDGFKKFIEDFLKVVNATATYYSVSYKALEGSCDAIFKNEKEIEDYCNDKHIPL